MFGKKKKRVEISAPSNFEHRVHTGFDQHEQKFTGLPRQWQSLIEESARRPKPLIDPACITSIQPGAPKTIVRGSKGAKDGALTLLLDEFENMSVTRSNSLRRESPPPPARAHQENGMLEERAAPARMAPDKAGSRARATGHSEAGSGSGDRRRVGPEKRPKSSRDGPGGPQEASRDKRPLSGPDVSTPQPGSLTSGTKLAAGRPFNTYPRADTDHPPRGAQGEPHTMAPNGPSATGLAAPQSPSLPPSFWKGHFANPYAPALARLLPFLARHLQVWLHRPSSPTPRSLRSLCAPSTPTFAAASSIPCSRIPRHGSLKHVSGLKLDCCGCCIFTALVERIMLARREGCLLVCRSSCAISAPSSGLQ